MASPEDMPIRPIRSDKPEPTQAVMYACYALAELVTKQMGTLNGSTALHWHLINVIQLHAGHRATEETKS